MVLATAAYAFEARAGGDHPILMRERQAARPFRFKFKVPLVPARAEVSGREAVAGGLRVRRERLVLAPMGLKVRACFEGLAGGSGTPRLVLEPGPWLAPMPVSAEGAGCYRWVIAGGVSELSGRQTLKLFGPDGQHQPWAFELDLPLGVHSRLTDARGGPPPRGPSCYTKLATPVISLFTGGARPCAPTTKLATDC